MAQKKRVKVLVTGDKGYIGSNLVPFLEEKGFEVVGYDLVDGKDILNKRNLKNEMEGCSFVYHLAAISGLEQCHEDQEYAFDVNVQGSRNVVDVAIKLGAKAIVVSSFAVKTLPLPSHYANTKRLCEALSDRAVVLRPSNVFGGKGYFKKDLVIARFSRDNPIMVYGGKQKRDFVHIRKVLDWCLKAQSLPNGIYEVCSGQMITIDNLALIFSEVRGVEIEYWPLPEWERGI